MNERIKYLVEQANVRAFIQLDGSLTPELKKFTEVIVKECSYLADQAHKKATGGKSAGGYIRQHFGVE